MNNSICYLNGQYLPLTEARISPLDRGFLYSDGVYEVIPVYSRYPFRMDEHLRRLQDSLLVRIDRAAQTALMVGKERVCARLVRTHCDKRRDLDIAVRRIERGISGL